jgi:hypothetical protein
MDDCKVFSYTQSLSSTESAMNMLSVDHLRLVVCCICGLVRCRGTMFDKMSCGVDNLP